MLGTSAATALSCVALRSTYRNLPGSQCRCHRDFVGSDDMGYVAMRRRADRVARADIDDRGEGELGPSATSRVQTRDAGTDAEVVSCRILHGTIASRRGVPLPDFHTESS